MVNALTGIPVLAPLQGLIEAITLGGVNANNVAGVLDEILALEVPAIVPIVGGLGILELIDDLSVDVLGSIVGNVLTAADTGGFWYVLPNDVPAAGKSTLMTLKGTFKGVSYYYPFEINGPDADVTVTNNATANDYVKRNTIYRLNVRFKGSLVGSEDPDSTQKLENIEVTVEPIDWYGPVNQDVEW